MAYLDPKNDLTFKKVFGQHPNLCISLLNSLLPLANDEVVESIEYLPTELVPELPLGKSSIVDVRCRDNKGRQFIVEMQMFWTDSFQYRVLFNASKAFVRQLGKGGEYKLLQPVYSLNLVNERFIKDEERYYHHYQIVNIENTGEQIKGLEFVFVELPKFKPQSITQKKMTALWLRFLTEIGDGTKEIHDDLKSNPEIKQALEIIQESAFTSDELAWYDKYWDMISTERTYLVDSENKGKIEGRIEGKIEAIREIAINSIKSNLTNETIKLITGLSDEEIDELRKNCTA